MNKERWGRRGDEERRRGRVEETKRGPRVQTISSPPPRQNTTAYSEQH